MLRIMVQFYYEDSQVVKPNQEEVEIRSKIEYELFTDKNNMRAMLNKGEYSDEEKYDTIDFLTRDSCLYLDLDNTRDKEFFDLINSTTKFELWGGEYELVDKIFRPIAPKSLRIIIRKINKNK